MIWLLLACRSETDSKPQATENDLATEITQEADGPYLLDDETEAIGIDIPALESEIHDIFAKLFSFKPQNILDAYQEIMQGATSDCPRWFVNEDGTEYWFDYCTTAEGYSFDGYGTHLQDFATIDEQGTDWTGHNFWGLGTVRAPDGRTVKTTGGIFTRLGTNPNGTTTYQASITEGSSLSDSDNGWEQNTAQRRLRRRRRR